MVTQRDEVDKIHGTFSYCPISSNSSADANTIFIDVRVRFCFHRLFLSSALCIYSVGYVQRMGECGGCRWWRLVRGRAISQALHVIESYRLASLTVLHVTPYTRKGTLCHPQNYKSHRTQSQFRRVANNIDKSSIPSK